MARPRAAKTIGNRIAPPRFILFVLLLGAGIGAGISAFGWRIGTMAGFDLAAFLFLVSLVPVLGTADSDEMREHAARNDANRVVLLGLTGVVTAVVLVTVAAELRAGSDTAGWSKVLIVATLALAWLFSNAVYALHYAHLFYSKGDDGRSDAGGLDFAGEAEPLYWDFVYFAFTLGMTFQTSDTAISNRRLRRVAIVHSTAAFGYNIGVLAFTINVLGS
jgi:uncharacterized membrane protein